MPGDLFETLPVDVIGWITEPEDAVEQQLDGRGPGADNQIGPGDGAGEARSGFCANSLDAAMVRPTARRRFHKLETINLVRMGSTRLPDQRIQRMHVQMSIKVTGEARIMADENQR